MMSCLISNPECSNKATVKMTNPNKIQKSSNASNAVNSIKEQTAALNLGLVTHVNSQLYQKKINLLMDSIHGDTAHPSDVFVGN